MPLVLLLSRSEPTIQQSLQLPHSLSQTILPLPHEPDGFVDWIGQLAMFQIEYWPNSVLHATSWYPDHSSSSRHRSHDHRIGSNPRPLTDGDGAKQYGRSSDNRIVADGGMAFLLLQAGAAQNDSLVYEHIIPDLCCLADDYAHAMVYEEPSAHLSPGVDLDPGEEAPHVGQQASGQPQSMPPELVCQAMAPESMQTGIADHHLQQASGRRVPGDDRVDILFQRPEDLPHPSIRLP
jgi:hypothetical protein